MSGLSDFGFRFLSMGDHRIWIYGVQDKQIGGLCQMVSDRDQITGYLSHGCFYIMLFQNPNGCYR